jgi:hypothetical protein
MYVVAKKGLKNRGGGGGSGSEKVLEKVGGWSLKIRKS